MWNFVAMIFLFIHNLKEDGMNVIKSESFETVELLINDNSDKTISYVTCVKQFYNLAKMISKKGLSLKKLAEFACIEFDKMVSFFEDNSYMKPGDQAAIQKVVQNA